MRVIRFDPEINYLNLCQVTDWTKKQSRGQFKGSVTTFEGKNRSGERVGVERGVVDILVVIVDAVTL